MIDSDSLYANTYWKLDPDVLLIFHVIAIFLPTRLSALNVADSPLADPKVVENFYKKELPKTDHKEFRVEKVIKTPDLTNLVINTTLNAKINA